MASSIRPIPASRPPFATKFNPAATFGPIEPAGKPLARNSLAGIRPIDAPGFIAAQLAGTALALALANLLLDRRPHDTAA